MNNEKMNNENLNKPVAEWINTSEEAKSNFNISFNISFTREISEEQAKQIILEYIVNTAERLMMNDSQNYFNHLQYVRVEAEKNDTK